MNDDAKRIVCVRCNLPITQPTLGGSHMGPVHRWMEDCISTLRHAHDDAKAKLEALELEALHRAQPGHPTTRALRLVAEERVCQDAKWKRTPGAWMDNDGIKLAVLGEEFGEVARALLEQPGRAHLLSELVQVAAVAVAWAETVQTLMDVMGMDPDSAPLPAPPDDDEPAIGDTP